MRLFTAYPGNAYAPFIFKELPFKAPTGAKVQHLYPFFYLAFVEHALTPG
jgi:hypothetical protein